jgi:hypothetical protein
MKNLTQQVKKWLYNIIIGTAISICPKMKKILHYSRLGTMLNVENILRNAKTLLSRNEIGRRLAKKIMGPTLNLIFTCLKGNSKINIAKKGVAWIHNNE